jgi:hypothetical protein
LHHLRLSGVGQAQLVRAGHPRPGNQTHPTYCKTPAGILRGSCSLFTLGTLPATQYLNPNPNYPDPNYPIATSDSNSRYTIATSDSDSRYPDPNYPIVLLYLFWNTFSVQKQFCIVISDLHFFLLSPHSPSSAALFLCSALSFICSAS